MLQRGLERRWRRPESQPARSRKTITWEVYITRLRLKKIHEAWADALKGFVAADPFISNVVPFLCGALSMRNREKTALNDRFYYIPPLAEIGRAELLKLLNTIILPKVQTRPGLPRSLRDRRSSFLRAAIETTIIVAERTPYCQQVKRIEKASEELMTWALTERVFVVQRRR